MDKKFEKPKLNLFNEAKSLFNYKYKLIGYLVFATVFLSGFALVVMPQVQNYRSVKDISSYRKALDEVVAVRQSLQKTQDALKIITPEIMAKLDNMLPKDSKDSELTIQVKNIVERAGFKFSSLGLQKARALSSEKGKDGKMVESSLKVIELTFTAGRGTYSGLRDLLSMIYQNLRLMEVKTLTFSGAKSMDVSLQVTTFILP